MKILCVFGRHNYGDPSRGEGYEYSNFLPALRALGHEVECFESWNRDTWSGFVELNRALLEKVAAWQPDVLFCVLMGYEVWLETLDLVRDTGVFVMNWATDDSWKYEEFSRLVAGSFDAYATTYRSALVKAQKDGHRNFVLTQWAATASLLLEPRQAEACRYSVSFVGAAYGNRLKWVAELRRRGIVVTCFGHGWEGGVVTAADIPRIINDSVVSLNFGDSGLRFKGGRLQYNRQIKARVFEVPAAGGCLLTEPAEDLAMCYELGEEIETYGSVDELEEKILFLLKTPEQRNRIAKAGHERTRREHTYERRLADLLARVPVCRRPARAIDWVAFDRLVQQHRLSPGLYLLRWLLVLPCCLLWGRQRGRRAARRLLFELCWRFAGRHTYTAAGWPGRLFYLES